MECYLCHHEMEFFLDKNGYTVYQCPFCGLKTTKLEEPYESFVTKFYSKGYYTGGQQYAAYADYEHDRWHIGKNLKKFLKKIKQRKPFGKFLDVGCALGYMVEFAIGQGYDAYGFDPSSYAISRSNTLNGRLQKGTIHSVRYPERSFDVVTMFDVVEHLGDPIEDIKKLATLLKDDGIMVIATGNTGSLAARLFKRRWTFYIPPQHLYFFNKETFGTVLSASGLVATEWFGIGKWLSLRYVLHLARSTGESKLAEKLYTFVCKFHLGWIPLYIPMGDNMAVIAQKKIWTSPR